MSCEVKQDLLVQIVTANFYQHKEGIVEDLAYQIHVDLELEIRSDVWEEIFVLSMLELVLESLCYFLDDSVWKSNRHS